MRIPNRSAPHALLALIALSSNPVAAAEELETLVVSATRSSVPAAELSNSIRTLSAEELAMIGAVHISEVLARVPGAWINRGNGQENLTAIRSPVFTGAGSCGAFYVAEDGVPIRPPGVCNVNELSEINGEQAARIEVLRGPGTAVHGSNAQHGVINVISMPPPETPRDASLSLEGGPNEYARLLGSYGEAHPEHAWRLSINAAHDGGYKDDSGFDQQKLSYRHDVAWSGVTLASLLSLANLNQETAGFVVGEDAYKHSGEKRENPNPEAFRDNKTARWQGRFDIDLGASGTLAITPYLRYQDMRFLQHFLLGQPLEENGLRSVGWQSAWELSLSDALLLSTGIDAEYSDSYLQETQREAVTVSVLPTGKHYDYRVDSLNGAAFAQLRWEASSTTRVMAGLRLEEQDYDYDNRMLDGATRDDGSNCGSPAQPLPCRYSRPADRNDSFGEVSLNAGISHALTSSQEVILNIAHGFRPPQTAELYRLQSGQLAADINSEQIDSIELGWRGSWAAFDYNLSSYYMEKSDVIFQDSERRNVDGAATEHYGFEYSLAWRLATHWMLSADGTLARHRYADDAPLQGLAPGTSIEGRDIDTAPRSMASLRLGWTPDPRTTLELEWQHIGRYFLEPTDTYDYPGHELLHLRLRRELGHSLMLGVRVTNLGDEDYAERADYAFGDYRYFVGEPRSLFVELGWQL